MDLIGDLVKKSDEEVAAIQKRRQIRLQLKDERKRQQVANVTRKSANLQEHKDKCAAGQTTLDPVNEDDVASDVDAEIDGDSDDAEEHEDHDAFDLEGVMEDDFVVDD